ncbi:MAG TPA: hypothetical protein VGN99_00780 [Steroidobacteraceae bacterium]|nr:hypothetical protein [Steroidobacteraceae bacterium]
MLTVFLLMILLGVILIAIPKQPLSLREQNDREFDALLARERERNPLPMPPAFGWPRTFYLKDSERAFLQREPWGLFAVLFLLLIAITIGGVYLRVHELI